MIWLTAASKFISRFNLQTILLIAVAVGLISVGAIGNGYRWGEKYAKLETAVANERIAEKDKVNAELNELNALQLQYVKWNEETYSDLRTKLDEVAANVASYGTRVVRVCSIKARSEDSVSRVPETPGVPDGETAGDIREGVERDTGPGWSGAGYDIFPEVNALMAKADSAATTCNKLIDYDEKRANVP